MVKRDLSEINLLRNQRDYGKYINDIKKTFASKKQGVPTSRTKYNQFLTLQQPILNELNYIAEKQKTENIQKQKDDFEFTEKLKEEREKKMKELTEKKIKDKETILVDLFGEPSKPVEKDLTPTISTALEDTIADTTEVIAEEGKKEKSASLIQRAIKARLARVEKQKLKENPFYTAMKEVEKQKKETQQKDLEMEQQKKQEQLNLKEAIQAKQTGEKKLQQQKNLANILQGALKGKKAREQVKAEQIREQVVGSTVENLTKKELIQMIGEIDPNIKTSNKNKATLQDIIRKQRQVRTEEVKEMTPKQYIKLSKKETTTQTTKGSKKKKSKN